MFNRRELLLLRAMYRHDTVTAAAASVNMTQPAASALLRDMETRLGFALFSRENRRLHLTSQGRALIPEVLNALAGIEAVDRLAVDIRQGALARLDVGAVAIAASSLLPPALAGMRQAHPTVAVTVRAGTALEIIEMAVDHRIDLGIIIGAPSDIDRVSSLRLAPLSLHAVMAPDHPWARQSALTLEQVANAGPIVLPPPCPPAAQRARRSRRAACRIGQSSKWRSHRPPARWRRKAWAWPSWKVLARTMRSARDWWRGSCCRWKTRCLRWCGRKTAP